MTSARLMKSSPASAMIRLRSSEGWNEKSNPGHAQCRLDPAVLAQAEFLGEQIVDRLDAVDLALLDAAQHGVEHLERARHLQADQAEVSTREDAEVNVMAGPRSRAARRSPGR
jgi:hypothetical protein